MNFILTIAITLFSSIVLYACVVDEKKKPCSIQELIYSDDWMEKVNKELALLPKENNIKHMLKDYELLRKRLAECNAF